VYVSSKGKHVDNMKIYMEYQIGKPYVFTPLKLSGSSDLYWYWP
jgi:hypothetical protein